MHELGICDALLKMVDCIARDEGLACVIKVTVEVGSLSGVVPAYLADCWEAVTDGTPYHLYYSLRIHIIGCCEFMRISHRFAKFVWSACRSSAQFSIPFSVGYALCDSMRRVLLQ